MIEPERLGMTEHLGLVISNLDLKLDGVEEILRAGKYYVTHAAWEHFGRVWFHGGDFKETVMRHGRVMETMSAPTLEELIEDVNNKYGRD